MKEREWKVKETLRKGGNKKAMRVQEKEREREKRREKERAERKLEKKKAKG